MRGRGPAARKRWRLARAAPLIREIGRRARFPRSAAPASSRKSGESDASPANSAVAASTPPQNRRCRRHSRSRRGVRTSWPPPRSDRRLQMEALSSRKASAPTPMGPPSLCEEKNITSAPVVANVVFSRPTDCIASQTSTPVAAWISARRLGDGLDDAGFIVDGLQREHDPPARVAPRSASSSAAREMTPVRRQRKGSSRVGGKAMALAGRRDARRRRSAARRTGGFVAPRRSAGVSARFAASVAPLVKTTLRAAVPNRPRDRRRARLQQRLAPPGPRHGPRKDCRACPAPPSIAVARLRAQRRCGVVVEIDAGRGHGLTAPPAEQAARNIPTPARPIVRVRDHRADRRNPLCRPTGAASPRRCRARRAPPASGADASSSRDG